MQKLKHNKTLLICHAFLIFTLYILIWRCKYGMGWNDEGFYLALVHRFFSGEIPIFHEWWVAQTFAPFLVPIYSLYVKLQGNNEGAYLFFRILFVIINYLIAVLIYTLIRKYEKRDVLGVLMAFLFMIYARDNILTESYYSLALQTLMVTLLIVYFLINNPGISNIKRNVLCFTVGVMFAIAMAANPFICFMYVIIILIFLIFAHQQQISYQSFFCFLSGTVATGLVYISVIFTRVTIHDFISTVKHILGNSLHPKDSMVIALVKGVWYTVKPFGMDFELPLEQMKLYMLLPIGVYFLILLITVLNNFKLIKVRGLFLCFIATMLLILFLLYAINANYVLGGVFSGVTLTALPLFLLTSDKNLNIFLGWYLPGIALAFCFQLASDTGFNAMTVGYTISAIASISIIYSFFADKAQQLLFKVILAIIIIVLLVPTFYLRIFSVFRDAPINELTYKIDRGSWAGVYTTDKNYDQVNAIIDALEKINVLADESDQTLITEMCPWGYTYLNTQVGAPTVWRNPFDSPILSVYYSKFPEKMPDYVLILNEDFGYHNRGNKMSGIIHSEIENNKYKKIDVECGVIYYK